MAETNPNGANGTTSDPREQTCWDIYLRSITAGQENAYKSAIDAGYSEDHSRNITLQGWFKARLEKLRRIGMQSKAERNLDKMLDTEWDKDEKVQPEIMRIVADVSKTVVTRLGKDDGWAERQEHSGVNGGSINIKVTNYGDQLATSIPSETISATIIESVG
jgi:hypothetical protein